jgi:uncharacterized membrane protein YfcA
VEEPAQRPVTDAIPARLETPGQSTVYVFKMSQHEAQGTSLATLLLPIGLLGFLEYYRNGHVDLRVAAWLAFGFAVGVFVGGRWAQALPDVLLRRIFALTLVAVAARMWFER